MRVDWLSQDCFNEIYIYIYMVLYAWINWIGTTGLFIIMLWVCVIVCEREREWGQLERKGLMGKARIRRVMVYSHGLPGFTLKPGPPPRHAHTCINAFGPLTPWLLLTGVDLTHGPDEWWRHHRNCGLNPMSSLFSLLQFYSSWAGPVLQNETLGRILDFSWWNKKSGLSYNIIQVEA